MDGIMDEKSDIWQSNTLTEYQVIRNHSWTKLKFGKHIKMKYKCLIYDLVNLHLSVFTDRASTLLIDTLYNDVEEMKTRTK